MTEQFDLDAAIRKIKDFPKPGILFYDITSVLTNPQAFAFCLERMEQIYGNERLDAVAAIESRGFLFAAPFALRRKLPLILIRKKGKLPGETYREEFTLEYGTDIIEAHKADIKAGSKVLLVDDLIATGGTLKAAGALLGRGGASVAGVFAVIGLPFLKYDRVLSGMRVETLIEYHGE
jgi:adenine phosphoribosyltransferase